MVSIAERDFGKGKITIVSDSRFLESTNLAYENMVNAANVTFIRSLLNWRAI